MSKANQNSTKSRFWNRVQIVMIFVVFTAPLLGAYFYKPSSFNNYGDIYTPVRIVDNLKLSSATDNTELDDFRRQWIFLVTAENECSQACENNLLKIRQIRFMQNQNMTRIRPMLLQTGLQDDVAADLRAKYSPVEVYSAEKSAFDAWTQVLRLENAPEAAQRDRIYVIDPAGNLVISYSALAEPKSIHKDIKRLLKTSQIG